MTNTFRSSDRIHTQISMISHWVDYLVTWNLISSYVQLLPVGYLVWSYPFLIISLNIYYHPKYVPSFMYLGISSKCLGHIEFNLYDRSKMTLRLKTSPIRDDQDKSDYTPSYLHTTLHNNNNNNNNTNNLPPRLCIFTSVKLIARL